MNVMTIRAKPQSTRRKHSKNRTVRKLNGGGCADDDSDLKPAGSGNSGIGNGEDSVRERETLECKSEDEMCENSMFFKGKRFSSWIEFENMAEAFGKKNFVLLVKRDSHKLANEDFDERLRPFHRAVFVCHHGESRKSRSIGIRKNKTCKLDCPFKLRINFDLKKKVYIVKEFVFSHNHDIDKTLYDRYPANRKPTEPQIDLLKPLIDNEIPTRLLTKIAKKKFDKPVVTKDIANIVQKYKKNIGGDISELEKVINEISAEDPNSFVEILTLEDSDQLQGVFFQYSKMQPIFETFGHMVFVDVTYNVNMEGYHLMTFLVADGENCGQPIGYAYICNESKPILSLVLEAFVKTMKFSNRNTVEIFMVDKDMKCINSLHDYFPKSQILLCYFHVMKHFKEKIKSDVTGTLKVKEEILQQIRLVVTSKCNSDYDRHFSHLKVISPESLIQYYQKNWEGDIQSMFVHYHRRSLFHIGNDTNNLIESHHRVIKNDLKRNHHLPYSAKVLFELYHKRYEETAHSIHLNHKMKRPFKKLSCDAHESYYQLCTMFAFKLIKRQLDLFDQYQSLVVGGYESEPRYGHQDAFVVQVQKTFHNVCVSNWSCDCSFNQNFHLPCHHIFQCLSHKDLPLYNENTVHSRYFNRTSEALFQLNCSAPVISGNTAEGFNMRRAKTFTSSDKYFYCKGVMNNICDISSELSSDKFDQVMDHLEKFYHILLRDDFDCLKAPTTSENCESMGAHTNSTDGTLPSHSSKTFTMNHLGLKIPKAKRKPMKKKISFYPGKKSKPQQNVSEIPADLESLNLDHSYTAHTDHNRVKIEPGTPITVIDSGERSHKSVSDHSDIDHATSVPVRPITSTPNISIPNIVTSESPSLKKESMESSSDKLLNQIIGVFDASCSTANTTDCQFLTEDHRKIVDLEPTPCVPFSIQSNDIKQCLSDPKNILKSEYWLTGDDINGFQYILSQHERFSKYEGFQDVLTFPCIRPLAGQCKKRFIQIANIRNSHWITISNVFSESPNEVNVYDSMASDKFDSSLITLVSSIMRKKKFQMTSMRVTQQTGGNDCGLFACAFAASLLLHQNPVNFNYVQSQLRSHFLKIIQSGVVVPFPAGFKRETRGKSNYRFSKMIQAYCYCKLANIEECFDIRMIMCDKCNDYYHEFCVTKIPDKVWEDKSSKYCCPTCSD